MRGAYLVPGFLLGGAAYLWYVASHFRGGVGRYEVLGPDFFPKLLLGGLIVVSLLQLLLHMMPAGGSAEPGSARKPIHWRDLALALAITAAYAASLELAGFLLTTLAFQVLLLALVFRVADWRLLLGVPLGLTGLLAVIFLGLMNVPLPRGRWLFADFSRLVY